MSIKTIGIFLSFLFMFCRLHVQSQPAVEYDIVITGGRVIDPETKFDAIRNVGIIQNRIAQISTEPLKGKQIINANGLVVAPGFIDLHVHGRSNQEQEFQLHDGVTTALELEFGIEFMGDFLAARKSKALINYGGSVSWPFERFQAFDTLQNEKSELLQAVRMGTSGWKLLFDKTQTTYGRVPTRDQQRKTHEYVQKSLEAGALGIGIPIAYVPGAKPEEVFRMYQLAAKLQVPVFTHVREGGIMAVQQAIADAELSGAALHIHHINSSPLGNISFAIELIQIAKNKGLNISTELYPYTAGSTAIESAVFNEGWQERLSISYGDLAWVATGERLTKETFDAYRKTGGIVILHSMKPEWIKAGITASGTIIASDAVPYAKLAHPRSAGTFSRVLGKYVREDKALDLMAALEKMTLLPAQTLESASPMMRFKGRIQVGADADITIFNPNTIRDKATFEQGLAFSEGVEYVIVNGTLILKNGKTVGNVFPGQPIYGKYKK